MEYENDKVWQMYHLNSQIFQDRIEDKSNTLTQITYSKSLIFKNFERWDLEHSNFSPEEEEIADLLKSSYSLRKNAPNRRTAPSAGALYPINIYLSINIEETQRSFPNGLYYYHIEDGCIYLVKNANHLTSPKLFIQQEANNAKVIIYYVANFTEMAFRYGERGYRYVFLETGHIAQNFNLNAIRLGLPYKNIGGYYERTVNLFLDLDGLNNSCIYCMAIF